MCTEELVSGWNEDFAASWNEALNEMKFSRQGNKGGSAIPTFSLFMERRASSSGAARGQKWRHLAASERF